MEHAIARARLGSGNPAYGFNLQRWTTPPTVGPLTYKTEAADRAHQLKQPNFNPNNPNNNPSKRSILQQYTMSSFANEKKAASVEVSAYDNATAEPTADLITDDVWNVTFEDDSNRLRWAQKNLAQRAFTVLIGVLRAALVLGLLYIFIIGLDLLGSAFQIVGGTTAGRAFRSSDLFNNPIAGLVIGILATVLVQSSSTSTSIIITMTASNLMTVDQAVPMIMGANIGM